MENKRKERTVIEKPTFGPIDLVNTELYMFKMCEICSAEKDWCDIADLFHQK